MGLLLFIVSINAVDLCLKFGRKSENRKWSASNQKREKTTLSKYLTLIKPWRLRNAYIIIAIGQEDFSTIAIGQELGLGPRILQDRGNNLEVHYPGNPVRLSLCEVVIL